MFQRFRYLWIALAILAVTILFDYVPVLQTVLKNADLRIFDSLLRIRYALTHNENQGVYDNICIVDIDEQSIAELGQYSAWPSLFFADLVNILSEDEPLAIGFDVFFTESDSITGYARKRLKEKLKSVTPASDLILNYLSTDHDFAKAMQKAGNVYLAMFNSDTPSPVPLPDKLTAWRIHNRNFIRITYPHPPITEFSQAARGVGFAHIVPDESGTIHDYPIFLTNGSLSYVNFSMQMALDLMGVNRIRVDSHCNLFDKDRLITRLPLSPDSRFYFHYYGPQKSFRYISFSDVIFRRIPAGYFNNRIVLVGASASGLRDIKSTPLDQNYPGVELHATFLRNVLEDDFIRWLSPWFILGVNIFLLTLMALFIPKAKPLLSISLFIGLSLLSIPATYLLYAIGSYTYEYTSVILPWVFGFLGLFTIQSHEQGVEKRKVRTAFEHYVSKDVIGEVMKGSQKLIAGGEKKTISIMYVDVRNFTTLCENLSPNEITTFMNNYFNLATDVIIDNRGMLDKYIGDEILGLFGAPVSYEGFELNAVKSAITIRNISFKLAEEYANHPVLKNFRVGAGIGTGEVVVGNIGSNTIFNYTGIGDRMNFSSRLEGLNKVYHTSIIIDQATYEKVNDVYFCRKLDRVKVKGKSIESDIYEVVDSYEVMPKDSRLITCYRIYETALALMDYDHKEEARELLKEVHKEYPDDVPTNLMLERIEIIDWETWEGAWQYDSK